ncbi:integrase, partial [Lysinibacillus sp. OL1_EC]|nr:integrase [Lysinibacillus sp. OL1_EC]
TTTLKVASVDGFTPFTQVTIFDDTNTEDVLITAIDASTKTITVQALAFSYKKGAKVARSNVAIDTVNAEMGVGDWQTYNVELVEVV